MKNCRIVSPMPWGNGAYVLHKSIEKHMKNYSVMPYNPYLTIFPPLLKTISFNCKNTSLIHTVPDYGLFFFSRKIPMVTTVHHYMCDGEMKPYSSFMQNLHYQTDLKWFIKKSLSFSTEVTAVSNYTANHIKEKLKLKRKIHVIHNGIDESFYFPLNKKEQKSSIRVLFSGNISKRKGSHWLSGITEKLNSNIIVQYTTGLMNKQKYLSNSNLLCLGRVSFKDMPDLYRQHDILISPTVREGFGLAIAEAMATGLPVVASDCSAIPELIDHGKGGFLCPVGDVETFAEKINILSESPDLRKEMGEYNRAKVEKMFTLDRMVQEYKDLFEKVMDNAGKNQYGL